MTSPVYLEYVPEPAAMAILVDLRQRFESLATGRPVPDHELHLTVLHVGKAEAVQIDLRRYDPGVGSDAGERIIREFAARAVAVLPPDVLVRPRKLAAWGRIGHSALVVLETDAGPELAAAQQVGRQLLEAVVRRQLGTDPYLLMRQSRSFRHSFDFKPHIALYRLRTMPENLPSGLVTVGLDGLPPELRLLALPPEHDLKTRQR